MSHITLIRHGQANSQARDEASYDRLSDLGHQQAAWLGEWLRAEDDSWPDDLEPDYHHMGGAHMAAGAANGVVDGDCRLHGSDNLYVASAATFPTAGFANPTVTIVALALRLGEHLTRTLAKV